jgi:glucose-6-phosphate 1-dehydrogenase
MPEARHASDPGNPDRSVAAASAAGPCAMVLFGATGDLTKRLVVPALYNLSRTKVLSEKFALIGVARAEGTAESWRDQLYHAAAKLCRQPHHGVRYRPH